MSTLCKDTILVDESESHPPVMIRIKDLDQKEFYSHIRHDISFAVGSLKGGQ